MITPNVDSLACRVLHERAATFDGRNHLIYFSPAHAHPPPQSNRVSAVDHITTRVASLQPILEWLAFRTPYEGVSLDGDALADWVDEGGRRRGARSLRLCEQGLGYKLHCLATAG